MPTSWIYRLKKPELIQEATARGVPTEDLTVEEIRKGLVEILKEEEADKMAENNAKVITKLIKEWNLSFKTTDNAVEFIERLEELIDASNVGKEDILPALPRILQGRALLWYRNYVDSWTDWNQFLQTFKLYYFPANYEEDLIAKIVTRKQGAQEKFTDYVTDILTLMRRYGSLDEAAKLHRIHVNMLHSYKLYIKRQDYKTLPELLKLGTEYENIRTPTYGATTSSGAWRDASDHNKWREDEQASSEQTTQGRDDRRHNNQRPKPEPRESTSHTVHPKYDPKTSCWSCGKPGHNADACRGRRQGNETKTQSNVTNVELLTEHVNFLIETVHLLSPNTTVLIWDDMYRDVKPMDCSNLILTDTEVVHWDYTTKPHEDVHINMYKYNRMFDNLWIATAFKGADGRERILPDLKTRFYNHLQWLNFIFDYGTLKKLYKIKGIILTGWSRYDHNAPLCEILPASIPSLIINLILVQKYTSGIVVENMKDLDVFIDKHIKNNLDSSLLCQNRTESFLNTFDSKTCHYEESDLYTTLQLLNNAYKYFVLKNNASSDEEWRIEYEYVGGVQTQVETCGRIFYELMTIEKVIIGLLSDYFENDVIIEYVQTKIRRLQENIKRIVPILAL
ncbi:uncharacterized protein LOC134750778 [Cydia strobilella]|uniref:uncharacterized protein LOC134750778 n=1 Tax=Cydia strobilella TaxID=1100964 RepID=UPI003004E1E1